MKAVNVLVVLTKIGVAPKPLQIAARGQRVPNMPVLPNMPDGLKVETTTVGIATVTDAQKLDQNRPVIPDLTLGQNRDVAPDLTLGRNRDVALMARDPNVGRNLTLDRNQTLNRNRPVAPDLTLGPVQAGQRLVAHPARNIWSKWQWGLMATRTASWIGANWRNSRKNLVAERVSAVDREDPVDRVSVALRVTRVLVADRMPQVSGEVRTDPVDQKVVAKIGQRVRSNNLVQRLDIRG